MLNLTKIYLFIYLRDFIYLFDRQRSQVGRERGGSRLPAEQRARCGARSQDLGIMTRAESRGFNPLSHPGTPKSPFFTVPHKLHDLSRPMFKLFCFSPHPYAYILSLPICHFALGLEYISFSIVTFLGKKFSQMFSLSKMTYSELL